MHGAKCDAACDVSRVRHCLLAIMYDAMQEPALQLMSTELKKIKDLNKTEKTAILLEALRKEGYNDNQIAQLVDLSRSRVCQVSKKINKGTLNPLVNKAKKSVKLLLEGQPVGTMKEVKGADVLTAAKMVLDRADPIVNKIESTNVAITYEIKPEERDRYRAVLGLAPPPPIPLLEERPPIEAVFEHIEESSNGRTEGFEPLNVGPIPTSSTNIEENQCFAPDVICTPATESSEPAILESSSVTPVASI